MRFKQVTRIEQEPIPWSECTDTDIWDGSDETLEDTLYYSDEESELYET